MARATTTVGYTCLVCRATGYNWHDFGFVPAPHTEHDDFLIRCDLCRVVFPTVSSLEHHLQIHARAHSGSEAPPNSPTFPTTTIREIPISSLEDQNVFRSESPSASRAQRSDVSNLPPGQRPPPYTSTQAPAELVHLRQLLLDATTHLVWLAASAARQLSVQPDMTLMSFMRQANLALIAPVSDVDVDFRQRLADDLPTSLASATEMCLSDIARILLPVYERWLLQARNAQRE